MRLSSTLIIALLLAALPAAEGAQARAIPELRTGDLVFQTSRSAQSDAIQSATGSPYSHVGIVVERAGRQEVIEAIATVSRTPLAKWVARGRGGRVNVLRDPTLTPAQREKLGREAETYLGRPYDRWFLFENHEIYCSELVYLAYRAAGIRIGRVERVADLRLGDQLVRKLLAARARTHPSCRGLSADRCTARLLEQTLVTPQSLAEDPRLQVIFSNYPE